MKVTNLQAGLNTQGIINSTNYSAAEKNGIKAANETINEANGTLENGASVQISEEARNKYHELYLAKMNMENIREGDEKAKEEAENIAKIMTIFRRICNGDIVPARDEKKLMEHSEKLYQVAKTAQMLAQNEDPKKYKSVDEDEEGTLTDEAVRSLTSEGGSQGVSDGASNGGDVAGVEVSVTE